MKRKFLIGFLALIVVVGVIYGYYAILKNQQEKTTIVDRIPIADYMGVVDLMQFSRELQTPLNQFHSKYRSFFSPEFIQTQAKEYHINLQKPSYLFGNLEGVGGVLISLEDSAKILQAIVNLSTVWKIKKEQFKQHTVYRIPEIKATVFYGKDYFCFLRGDSANIQLKHILYARHNTVAPFWLDFITKQQKSKRSLMVYAASDEVEKFQVKEIYTYPIFDSTQVSFQTTVIFKDTLPFKLKPGGSQFKAGIYTRMAANIHIDPNYFRNHLHHPLIQEIKRQGNRIGFPFHHFVSNWNGDLNFQQGGWVTVEKTIIESIFDEDFNVSEVKTVKEVRVPSFLWSYSTQFENQAIFESLLNTGVLTEQEKKYYLLFSPPLKYLKTGKIQTFYASKKPPVTEASKQSYVLWRHQGTQFKLIADSIKPLTFYGKLNFHLEHFTDGKWIANYLH